MMIEWDLPNFDIFLDIYNENKPVGEENIADDYQKSRQQLQLLVKKTWTVIQSKTHFETKIPQTNKRKDLVVRKIFKQTKLKRKQIDR